VRFVGFDEVTKTISGKRVALVGSAPSVMENPSGFIDSHEVVVRVNNYKIARGTGQRTDVHYSFYGTSVRYSAERLALDGVKLCMCKCPNSQPIESAWHIENNKREGIDFRYIYQRRHSWWFCDTWVPSDEDFLSKFDLLDHHIPTTGFAALLDVLYAKPAELYVTGFDFFRSKVHNVDEPWKPGREDDPIGHRPEAELEWLKNADRSMMRLDHTLELLLS
jgi:hypothetical protein